MVCFGSGPSLVGRQTISDGFCSKIRPSFGRAKILSTNRVQSKDGRRNVISGDLAVHRIRRSPITADQNVSRFVPFRLGSVWPDFVLSICRPKKISSSSQGLCRGRVEEWNIVKRLNHQNSLQRIWIFGRVRFPTLVSRMARARLVRKCVVVLLYLCGNYSGSIKERQYG